MTGKIKKNLTTELEETLMREIMLGIHTPGGTFPSELESVKRFQVSRVTVRRAYAKLEEKGILIRNRRCNTVVNDRLFATAEPISMVGALLPLQQTFSNRFLACLNDEAAAEKALIVLAPPFASGRELELAAMDMVLHGVRNLVVWCGDHEVDMQIFRRLRLLGINLVFFDLVNPGEVADFVSLDNRHAVESLLEKALQDGFRKFAFLNTADLRADSNLERENVFENFCRERKLEFSIHTLPWKKMLADGAAEECRTVYQAVPEPDKTAFFCVNQFVARSVCNAVGGQGNYYMISIPEDEVLPRSRCVIQPISEMAKECFQSLRRQQNAGRRWKAAEVRLKGCPDWL
ncbi:MAG: GntR family transcriptional regulator [Lentisphaeria bacterium]|nr:GntR family transcriptional regulator [Lentisphaeria bacterium]